MKLTVTSPTPQQTTLFLTNKFKQLLCKLLNTIVAFDKANGNIMEVFRQVLKKPYRFSVICLRLFIYCYEDMK
jgi:hypothetical protein